MKLRELAGFAGGAILAPAIGAGSFIRRGRIFHPDGVVYRAEVIPEAPGGAAGDVAGRLAGPAIVRLSSAIWRGGKERRPDLLGCAVRFRQDAKLGPEPADGDQDMLFVTMRSAWTALPALLMTNVHSWLMDDYYAVGVFDSMELGLVKWRLVAPRIFAAGSTRDQALWKAAALGAAVLQLEARALQAGARYEPVARIKLIEPALIDQDALRFSPFRAGRGILPRGFINALRIMPYPVSQVARPKHA